MTKQSAVAKDGDTHTYTCEVCGFVSSGWATQKEASARAGEHEQEHETGEAMSELPTDQKESK
jgi:hypothetical protein